MSLMTLCTDFECHSIVVIGGSCWWLAHPTLRDSGAGQDFAFHMVLPMRCHSLVDWCRWSRCSEGVVVWRWKGRGGNECARSSNLRTATLAQCHVTDLGWQVSTDPDHSSSENLLLSAYEHYHSQQRDDILSSTSVYTWRIDSYRNISDTLRAAPWHAFRNVPK